jgi:predicted P-loop ATPase/GTPase
LTEAELTEKITEIAKEISKNMIKTVLTEFSKKEGGIIVESKNIKKAEIVGKNKVKIGNTIYEVKKVPQ